MAHHIESNHNSVLLSVSDRLRQTEGVVLRHVAGEHMLVPAVTREVDLDSLFLLNATGVWVWEQMDGIRPVKELGEAVARHFSIEPSVALADVMDFLANLLNRNLAKRAGEHGH